MIHPGGQSHGPPPRPLASDASHPAVGGYPPATPWFDFPATQLLGIRSFAHGFTQQLFAALTPGFVLLFFFLLLFIIVRRERLAAVALWLIMAVALSLTNETLVGLPFAGLSALMVIWCYIVMGCWR